MPRLFAKMTDALQVIKGVGFSRGLSSRRSAILQ